MVFCLCICGFNSTLLFDSNKFEEYHSKLELGEVPGSISTTKQNNHTLEKVNPMIDTDIPCIRITDIKSDIIEETEAPMKDVRNSTIKLLLKQGLKDEQIVALFKAAYLNVSKGCKPISIGSVKKFAFRFIGEDFTEEQLDSNIGYLCNIGKHHTNISSSGCVCAKTLIKRALCFSQEHEIDDLRDLEDVLVESFFYSEDYKENLYSIADSCDEEATPWQSDLLENCC